MTTLESKTKHKNDIPLHKIQNFCDGIVYVSQLVKQCHQCDLYITDDSFSRGSISNKSREVQYTDYHGNDYPITFYNDRGRSMIKFKKFLPKKFYTFFKLSLAEISEEVNTIASEFYDNHISIRQQNILLNVIGNNIQNMVNLRLSNDVYVSVGDYVNGEPVHMTMDIVTLNRQKICALSHLVALTDIHDISSYLQ